MLQLITRHESLTREEHNVYLYILHVCVVQLFSKMLVFFEEIDNFPEIAVIMQSSVLKKKEKKNNKHKQKIY